MSISLFASYAALALGLFGASVLCKLLIALAFANKSESSKSAARVDGWWDALMGRGRVLDDILPDGRMKAGMIYNRRKNRLETSGRNTEETVARVFR